jgi:hypothetical protein
VKRKSRNIRRDREIVLQEIGPHTYKDLQTNFLIKKVLDKDKTLYVAYGIEENKKIRDLNQNEFLIALSG